MLDNKENDGIYYSYPHEVDAYTFEALFLKEKAKSTSEVIENIVKDLLVLILSKSDEGYKRTHGLIIFYR